MKNMLFRVLALSAVVAAGGYAIVQTQRHMGRSAAASDSLPGAAAATSADDEPQRLPTPKDANPLRPGSSTTDAAAAGAATGGLPANRVVQASGADDTTDRKPRLTSPGNTVGRPNVPDDGADERAAGASKETPAKAANPFFARNRTAEKDSAKDSDAPQRFTATPKAERFAPLRAHSAEAISTATPGTATGEALGAPRSARGTSRVERTAAAQPDSTPAKAAPATTAPAAASSAAAKTASDAASASRAPGALSGTTAPPPAGSSPAAPSSAGSSAAVSIAPSAAAPAVSPSPTSTGPSTTSAAPPAALKRSAEPGLLPGASTGGSLGRMNATDAASRDAASADPGAGNGDSPRGSEGTGKPGPAQLDGPQTPQLAIQKIAPPEVQVGRAALFQIRVKNIGPTVARHVEVRDEIPKGARLIDSTPRATRGVSGELVWTLGTMKPGDELNVQVQLMPVDEGEIGSVATVAFHADASAKTTATKPQLTIKASAPSKVLVGETIKLAITLSNPGTGVAQKVFLDAHIPQGLRHPGGAELTYEVGDLKPGESRQIDLQLAAAGPVAAANVLSARADGGLRVEDRQKIEVLAPQIDIAMEGPKRRYLEREATYTLAVSNPGTAPARQVELLAQLPPGLKFVSANNAGRYEETTRTVRWLLEELPVKESGSVELVTVPTEAGRQVLRLRGRSERSQPVEREHPVQIEGIAALSFEVLDLNGPIEVGGETTYEIRVVNQGSKAATNVEVVGLLAGDMKPVAAEGPTRHAVDGTRVVFEPLGTLAAKASTTYRVRAQGLKAGDQRFRVQLTTDEIRTPITKEESTRVYADE